MTAIEAALRARRTEIAQACAACGRDPADVRLLAVSKGQPAAAVAQAWAAGQRDFGENYVQEALDKIAALGALDAQWHFIGPLQSNKTARVAEHFAWVHSVDRLKLAERLSAQRPAELPPLNICIQVNISGEASKSGCTPDEAPVLCQAVATLPRLRLRGLMAIPAPVAPGGDARAGIPTAVAVRGTARAGPGPRYALGRHVGRFCRRHCRGCHAGAHRHRHLRRTPQVSAARACINLAVQPQRREPHVCRTCQEKSRRSRPALPRPR
jgi:PLP dependent protein